MLQEVTFLKQKLEIMQTRMSEVQANADAAVARAQPPPADDSAARRAVELEGQLRAAEVKVREAAEHVAALEHALECKEGARRGIADELAAAHEKAAGDAKQLQGAHAGSTAPTHDHLFAICRSCLA